MFRKVLTRLMLCAVVATALGGGQAAAQAQSKAHMKPMRVTASGIAPEARDSRGNRTSFVPANAVDGQLDTAWRVAGDGSNAWLMLEFPRLVQVAEVQISPGYAKIDRASGVDRFRQNRAVKRVRLEFSGGQTLEASLADSPQLQSIAVPNIDTVWVRVVVLETRAQAKRNGRNFTPISELGVYGRNAVTPQPSKEQRQAQATLVNFFQLLHEGRYDAASKLFGGNLDDLVQFNDPDAPRDAATVLANACRLLHCIPVQEVVWAQQIGKNEFKFGVAFTSPEGGRFVIGPCCGATEAEMPSQSVFYYTVKLHGSQFQVLEQPLYTP